MSSTSPPTPLANRPTLIRSDFWFADGNIVLLAGAAAFKVHRGQLERHSEVFRDLFGMPQPPPPPPPVRSSKREKGRMRTSVQGKGLSKRGTTEGTGNGTPGKKHEARGASGTGGAHGEDNARDRHDDDEGSVSTSSESDTDARSTADDDTDDNEEQDDGALALPRADTDLIDGCAWVELHDRPADVFYFLSALYDGLYIPTPRTPHTFPLLSAVLRLSSKYLVDPLRALCIAHLALDWPTTLAGWDARERLALVSPPSSSSHSSSHPHSTTSSTTHPPSNPSSHPSSSTAPQQQYHSQGEEGSTASTGGRYLPRDLTAHPILLIELAIELGLHALLPAAFYDLSRYGPSKIMGGVSVGAVALDVAAGFLSSTSSSSSQGYGGGGGGGGGEGVNGVVGGGGGGEGGGWGRERSVVLNREMLVRTFRGREAAQRYVSDFVARELEGRLPSAHCTSSIPTSSLPSSSLHPSSSSTAPTAASSSSSPTHQQQQHPAHPCTESFYFLTLNILRSVGGIACGRDADPLFTLTQAADMLSRTDFSDGHRQMGLRMCGECKREFRASVERARGEVWEALPGWFGLE